MFSQISLCLYVHINYCYFYRKINVKLSTTHRHTLTSKIKNDNKIRKRKEERKEEEGIGRMRSRNGARAWASLFNCTLRQQTLVLFPHLALPLILFVSLSVLPFPSSALLHRPRRHLPGAYHVWYQRFHACIDSLRSNNGLGLECR